MLKAEEFDVDMDFDSLRDAKTMLGSGAIIVIDDSRSIPEVAMRTARFYAHESCGQCAPCREGTHWVYSILDRLLKKQAAKKEIDHVVEACLGMEGKTICVLTEACSWPITSMIRKFRNEFEALAVSEEQANKELPLVSGQLGGLMDKIRERQNKG